MSVAAEKKLAEIIRARDAMHAAYKLPCTCSGFTIQYEGRCQCTAGQQQRTKTQNLTRLVNEL